MKNLSVIPIIKKIDGKNIYFYGSVLKFKNEICIRYYINKLNMKR